MRRKLSFIRVLTSSMDAEILEWADEVVEVRELTADSDSESTHWISLTSVERSINFVVKASYCVRRLSRSARRVLLSASHLALIFLN